ncbi:MAG: bacillithiol biosynthesis deacetylase BshB1 [Bacteroidetes bacterium]|nr:bacillithiol biosynthesis deacetylase BshB1 [Bacteroidota bacterium]
MKVDILAVGVHPDDVELSCSGTLIQEINRGKRVAILDLTEGELGTRGTVKTRYAEAANAAMIMGVHERENLCMRDGFIANDETHQLALIQAIRKYRPTIVLANAMQDRHPDHGKAGQLVADSCFLAGLEKIKTTNQDNTPQPRWRPSYVLHYIQDRFLEPTFIVDISPVFAQRMKAIKAYGTQFHNPASKNEEPETSISKKGFLDAIVARAQLLGKRIGVDYAEGFTTSKSIGLRSVHDLILNET